MNNIREVEMGNFDKDYRSMLVNMTAAIALHTKDLNFADDDIYTILSMLMECDASSDSVFGESMRMISESIYDTANSTGAEGYIDNLKRICRREK